MKISSFATFTLLTLCMHTGWLSVVVADRMVRMIFNDGAVPGTDNQCTDAEFLVIDPIFDISTHVRRRRKRHLSSISDANNDTVSIIENEEREMQSIKLSAKCKNNCAGFVASTCRATGCAGNRRRRHERGLPETVGADHRETSEWLSCYDQLNEINAALDTLITSTGIISQSCKNFLTGSKRRSECYDDIIYGEVTSFNFLNMIGSKQYTFLFLTFVYVPTVLQANVQNGYKVCSNVPINIEAIVNPCVRSTEFTLTGGPQRSYVNYKRSDDSYPMQIFTTSTPGSSYGGMYLKAGYYTLTATPDFLMFKTKQLNFQVVDCLFSLW